MAQMDLKGKKAVVVGAGSSGVAAVRLLASSGAQAVLNDLSSLDHLKELEGEGVVLAGGGHSPSLFVEAELIVLSPGVPSGDEPLAGIIADAIKRGSQVVSEVELGARFTTKPIIAVAGTNGKSTVTTLIGDILAAGGKSVFAGGNLGVPFTWYILEGDSADMIVLEVSSFQLERIDMFRPFISIMLNVTPDHLDRYPSMDAYAGAKRRLFMNQGEGDYALLNMEDPVVASMSEGLSASLVPFGVGKRHGNGVYLDGDIMKSRIPGYEGEMDISALRGGPLCNMENVMSIFAACLLSGVSEEVIYGVMKDFKGLPHRLEFVARIDGVDFYDDSKATNVGALVKSLENMNRRIVLIAGGKDKGGSYDPLKNLVREKVSAIILIGEAADRMRGALEGECPIVLSSSMDEAVDAAWRLAAEGDAVLLSPACSSFDMFKNYHDRGESFKMAVSRLESGEGFSMKEANCA